MFSNCQQVVCLSVCGCLYLCVCVPAQPHTCVFGVHVCVFVCLRTCVHAYICACACMRICVMYTRILVIWWIHIVAINSSGEVFVISKNGQRLCHIDNKVCATCHNHHGYFIKCYNMPIGIRREGFEPSSCWTKLYAS